MILCGDPRAQYFSHQTGIDRAIRRVLNKGRYILGSECENFEKEFSGYLGARYGVGVASGTDAIHLALRVLGIGPGDEVLTVSHTAVATVAAIVMSGATPVFVDIDPATFCIDPGKIKKRITRRTKAIIPVHLYGYPADLEAVLFQAKKFGLQVIEDCGQAHGAVYQRKKVGSFGDVGCFSFYPTKNLGAIGDGGMIVTSSKKIYEKSVLMRQYGWGKQRVSQIPGWNSRLDEIQAAILRVKLKTLDADNRRRATIAQTYQRMLAGLPVSLPATRLGTSPVYHQYVIRSNNRDALQKYLQGQGIQALIHYPVPVHQQGACPHFQSSGELRETEKAVREILSLPIYPELLPRHIEKTARAVISFYKNKRAAT